jgi:uncharacterized repeat protein (TIGR01451 family)/uncharacterized repeat protein (TIGR02543 family)
MPAQNVIITGVWKDDKNNNGTPDVDELFYDANGGDGKPYTTVGSKVEGETALTVTVEDNRYTKDGYTFTGWNTAADGSGQAVAVGSTYELNPDAVDTVYAQWALDEITYDVIYHSNYMNGNDEKATAENEVLGLDGIEILSPDKVKADTEEGKFKGDAFTSGLKWTDPESEKTYQFLGWSLAPKTAVVYQAGDKFNGKAEQAQQTPAADDAGVANTVTNSLRTLLAMVATTSKAEDSPLELYAQWGLITITKETTSTPPNGAETYAVGDTISYKITVTNDGSQPVTNITVTDKLVDGEWTIEKLGVGDEWVKEVEYVVKDSDVNAENNGVLTNVATGKVEKDPNDPDAPEVPVDPGETKDPIPAPTTPSGGGNPSRPPKDEPTEEPDEEIPEDDTPLAPAEIEEDDTEIDDGDTPYAGYEEEPDEEVAEEPTPFSPYTGDDRHTAAWGFVSLLSLAGIAVVARKRREEE